jgi:hypothetical protein
MPEHVSRTVDPAPIANFHWYVAASVWHQCAEHAPTQQERFRGSGMVYLVHDSAQGDPLFGAGVDVVVAPHQRMKLVSH